MARRPERALDNILLDFPCSNYPALAGKETIYGCDAFILMVSVVVPMVLPRESRLDFELTSRGERGPFSPAETERATTEDAQTRFTIYYRVDVAPQGQFFQFKAVLDLLGDGRHLIQGRRTLATMQPEPKTVTLHAEMPRGPY